MALCSFFTPPLHAQTSFVVGISVHLADNPSLVASELTTIQETGATSIRDDVHWSRVEASKGHLAIPAGLEDFVNQALKAKLQPLLILDYGNQFYDGGKKPASPEALSGFARFAVFVVQHFKGRVHMYEIWNEWDDTAGGTLPGSAPDYVRLLKVVYPAVKAADPSSIFIAGSVSAGGPNWLSGMLSSGAIGLFDGISSHPYNFSKHDRTPDAWAADLLATENVIHRYTGGRDLPLYVTEMGWPTYKGHGGSTPQEAGVFLAQMFLLARTMSFLKGVWWYDFRDDGPDPGNAGDNFGLVDPSLRPKPAFAAMKSIASVVKSASMAENLPTGNPTLRAVRFRLSGGTQLLALWNAGATGTIRAHAGGSSRLRVDSVEPGSASAVTMDSDGKEVTIDVSEVPVLISGTNLALMNR